MIARMLIAIVVLMTCLLGSRIQAATGATNVWYGGGSYDGSDRRSVSAGLFVLSVNNASGATNATVSSVWLNGMLLATSNGEAAVVRVYWGTTDATTNMANWANTNEFGSIDEGQFLTTNVTIAPNTTYYYRFYATNAAGDAWAYSSASFLTPSPPILTTGIGAIPVGFTAATLNGNLTGGVSASNYVFWGTTDWGTTNGNWANTNSLGLCSIGTFRTPASRMNPGTVYYYRCYGTNAYGPGWSDTVTFTTRVGSVSYAGGSYDGYDLRSAPAGLFTLSVNNASGATNITVSNAWLNGFLLTTSNGEAAVVRVYWGATNGSTNRANWANTNDFGNINEGQFLTTNVTISPNTTYYYRFYATNETGEGWAYSSATFLTASPPVLNTGIGAIPVGFTTATLYGNLTAGVSASNFIFWGTTDWGTTNNNWARTNSLGLCSVGVFKASVSGINPGTVFYYRCYGTNAYGPGWSDTVSFTTRVGSVYYNGGSYDGYAYCYARAMIRGESVGSVYVFY